MCALIKLIRKKSAVAWNLEVLGDLPSQREQSVGIVLKLENSAQKGEDDERRAQDKR